MNMSADYVAVYRGDDRLGRFSISEAARKAGIHANDLRRGLDRNDGVYPLKDLLFVDETGEE